jgi:anaerobic nitric oxide reductase transcription regulator
LRCFCDNAVSLASDAVVALRRYAWPGNVRELENVLSRATPKAASGIQRGKRIVLDLSHLGLDFAPAADMNATSPDPQQGRLAAAKAMDLCQATQDFQRAAIRRALAASGDNWAAAARTLGMHRSNFHHLASRLGLKEPRS